ncbi:MucR family transcriptional regulator [Sinorhizobium meliloti]|uniref:MucR family transcriptional regulator n=1 Tax=Rhizobium meliloti TaxID=382 RepID=UPI00398CBC79
MPRKKKDYTPLPGFPRETKFQCMEDIDRYFSGNSIQCLECGHHFTALPRHLTRAHEVSADEYKEKHGLPWGRGLTCGLFHDELSQKAKEDGSVANIGDIRSAPTRGRKLNTRDYCPARVNAKHVYSPETYFAFADRVAAGEPILTISREEAMPSVMAVRGFIEKNIEFARYWEERVKPNILPLRKDNRVSLESGRVAKAISMARGGATVKEIAAATGYSDANARLFLKGKTWKTLKVRKIGAKGGTPPLFSEDVR